jgi:hypothetical protein
VLPKQKGGPRTEARVFLHKISRRIGPYCNPPLFPLFYGPERTPELLMDSHNSPLLTISEVAKRARIRPRETRLSERKVLVSEAALAEWLDKRTDNVPAQ